MRILLSSKRFLPTLGGSVNYAVMLAGAFRRRGEEVIIMTRTPGTEESVADCMVVREPGWLRRYELAAWADLIFQVDASWQDVWPFLLRGVPWFPTIHCGKKINRVSLRGRLDHLGLGIAHQLGNTIPVGDQVARDWNLSNNPIHNPYDDRIFLVKNLDSPRSIDLLFVGRIERSKGVFVLIEALKSISEQLPTPPRCCFVGDGIDDRRLHEMTAAFGSGVHFEHAGRLSPHEVAQCMRNSKILVFPTTTDWIEASPLTPLEALACGCRIIAADSGGTRENIGPDGVLVASGDVNGLAEALLLLLTAPPPRDSDAIRHFLSTRTLDQVADLYLERFAAGLK